MLKVDYIEFTDSQKRKYRINHNQIESFPLIGGEEADMITSKSWNQHGNTFLNAVMESVESELIFILIVRDKTEIEIEEARKALIDICNPLNGQIEMSVRLTSGSIYKRDIVFVSNPIFPVGLENRNPIWQKVQLQFEANNPFWYAENKIVEDFVTSVPLFEFPFEMNVAAPVEFSNLIANQIATNTGQLEAPVEIQIRNRCKNPKITNKTTGEYIRFSNLTMATGDVLIINTEYGRKKVELNGVNVFNTLDFTSTFFNLVVGENEIEFTEELIPAGNAKVTLIFKKLYMTI